MKKRSITKIQRLTLVTAGATLIGILYSHGQVNNALNEAVTEVSGWVTNLKRFLLALAVIGSLYGGYRIYTKYMNGDPDVGKSVASWGAGVAFLLLVYFVVDTLFTVT